MLGLSHQVTGDDEGFSSMAHYYYLSRTREKINGTIEGDEFLGSSDVNIAGTDDLVHAQNCFGTISESCDPLCPTHTVELTYSEERRSGKSFHSRLRRYNTDPIDPRHLSRAAGHQ